ncbi:MAG: amidohydrolase [Gaiella sp.]
MRAATIITGARVHPVVPGRPDAEALAIADGRILALGTAQDMEALAGPATRRIELDGGLVLPGFQDAHAHPLHGGLASLRCDLYATTTADEHLEAIRRYAAEHPEREWIVGGGWSMDDFGGAMPPRTLLDEVLPGRPVMLETRDGHTAWLSTRALELAGITAATPDPPGGGIDREPGGTPSGTLQELAIRLVERVLPATTQAEWDEAFVLMQRELHRLGITAVQEASATPELVDAYLRAAVAGTVTLRIEANLAWVPERGPDQLAELVERRASSTQGRVRLRGAKLFQDGVVESFTAAMLDPYRDAEGRIRDTSGHSLYPPDDLTRIVTALDREGFQVHIHTIGDRAVREALDALEAAARANGDRDSRHHLAHLQFVQPGDIPRLARGGVGANVTPLWAVRSGYVEELTLPFVSPAAAAAMYPLGSLHRAGVRLAFGSDWPVSTPDPLAQLEVALSRRPPGEPTAEPLLPDEALDLRTAIHAATAGAAWVNGLDDVTGTLEPGKLADLVVLDLDLLAQGAPPPSAAAVVLTLVEGETVHDAR